MDPNTHNRAESDRWLGVAVKLLTARDFIGSKTLAIRAKEADPSNEISDQMLAIIETILAGEKRVNSARHPDWYTVLQLPRLVRDPDLIANHYRRLVALLNPERNRLPFSGHAFQLVMDAWSILSDPNKKWLFDNELAGFLQTMIDEQVRNRNQPVRVEATRVEGLVDPHRHQSAASAVNSVAVAVNNVNVNQIDFMQLPPQQLLPPQWQMRDPTPSKGGDRNKGVMNVGRGVGVIPSTTTNAITPIMPTSSMRVAADVGPQVPLPAPSVVLPTRVIDGNVGVINNNAADVVINCDANNAAAAALHENDNVVVTSVVVDDDNVVNENNGGEENEEEAVVESFWTSCPYCLYIFEYQKVYQDYTLRCQNCRRGFQAVQIPNPPPISRSRAGSGSGSGSGKGREKGTETSFCCWGFFPMGFSMVSWKKQNRGRQSLGNWVPFSPMFATPGENGGENFELFQSNGGAAVGPKKRGRPPKSRPKAVVVDDDSDFNSDPSDESSDQDWRRKPGVEKKRKKRKRGKIGSGRYLGKVKKQEVDVEIQKNHDLVNEDGGGVSVGGEGLEDGSNTQNAATGLNSGAKEDTRKKATAILTRNQARRRVKNMGKLDLNVEFNNEGDEHAPTTSAVNVAQDGVENTEFFEGLDEFFSSLPILNVVKEEKAKPS